MHDVQSTSTDHTNFGDKGSIPLNDQLMHRTNGDIAFPSVLKGKRVLLATESLGPINGVSKTTSYLIEYLKSHGVEVAVIAPEVSPSKLRTAQTSTVNLRLFGWPLPYNPDLTIVYPFRLDRVFRRTFKPDIIYLASPASVGFQIMLQTRLIREAPPVVGNFQTDLSSYSEIIFPARMDKYAVWLLGVVQGYLFNSPSVCTVFYPCSDIRQYLKNTGVQEGKLVQLGRGVDTEMFNPSRRDEAYRKELAPNGETIIVCVSRLAPEKGFDFLAKVATELAEMKIPFKLVIVGGNRNPSVEADIRKSFDRVKEQTIFTGFLTGIPLARVYASADLFLHCSITETFGLVVLESMASGVPVIARDQGGPSEIVRNNKTGLLVPPHDFDAFVKQVLTLCKDDSLRSRFAGASRVVALATTWEKVNNRAAWYIADSLQEHQVRRSAAAVTKVLLPRGVLRTSLHEFVGSVKELLKLWAAMGTISVFWVIACLPIILHGTLTFQRRN